MGAGGGRVCGDHCRVGAFGRNGLQRGERRWVV